MKKKLQLFIITFTILLVSCTPKGPQKNLSTVAVFDASYILQEYGIQYTIPHNLKLIHISNQKGDDVFGSIYVDADRGGRFLIIIHKNYCNLNMIDPLYAWGHLKGCVAASMKHLKMKYKEATDCSHHVYSSQAIYFKPGSFITPTLVFDKKLKFEKCATKLSFKSLGYAYRYNNAYYLIEIGYITNEDDYEYNATLCSNIIDSVVYPRKGNKANPEKTKDRAAD